MGIDWFRFSKCPCGGLYIQDIKHIEGRDVKVRDFCSKCGKTAGQIPDRMQMAAGEQFDEEPEHYE